MREKTVREALVRFQFLEDLAKRVACEQDTKFDWYHYQYGLVTFGESEFKVRFDYDSGHGTSSKSVTLPLELLWTT